MTKLLLKNQGFPEEDEIVLCTVTSIQYHSVFVELDEFPGKQGMIHIAEISPGRIRNLRDFVKEGKKIACKVLRVREDKGHIDLSLRRVNESQRQKKLNDVKQEHAAEKIIESVAKKNKLEVIKLFEEVYAKAIEHFDSLFECFQSVAMDEFDFASLKLKKIVSDDIVALIRERIQPPQVSIEGEFAVTSYASDGAAVISKGLQKAVINEFVEVRYKGAGKYSVRVTSENYKDAEVIMRDAVESATKALKKVDVCEFHRVDRKE